MSGIVISPGEIEDVLRTDPRGIVAEACVGVVSCGTGLFPRSCLP